MPLHHVKEHSRKDNVEFSQEGSIILQANQWSVRIGVSLEINRIGNSHIEIGL